VINRAQKKGDGDSTRLISKELSDLRKVPTLVGDCISGPFAPWEDVQWSSHTVRLTDHVINDALRTGSGCLCPTTGGNFHILEGIQPVELRRKGATLSPERRAMEPAPLLHSAFTNPPSGNAWHLKSRHPVAPAARLCFSSSDDQSRITRHPYIRPNWWGTLSQGLKIHSNRHVFLNLAPPDKVSTT